MDVKNILENNIDILSTLVDKHIKINNNINENALTKNQYNNLMDKLNELDSFSGSISVGGIDTSDATATPDKLVEGYSAYVKGEKIEGTLIISEDLPEDLLQIATDAIILNASSSDSEAGCLLVDGLSQNNGNFINPYNNYIINFSNIPYGIRVHSTDWMSTLQISPDRFLKNTWILGTQGTFPDPIESTASAQKIAPGYSAIIQTPNGGELVEGTMNTLSNAGISIQSINNADGKITLSVPEDHYIDVSEIEISFTRDIFAYSDYSFNYDNIPQGYWLAGIQGKMEHAGLLYNSANQNCILEGYEAIVNTTIDGSFYGMIGKKVEGRIKISNNLSFNDDTEGRQIATEHFQYDQDGNTKQYRLCVLPENPTYISSPNLRPYNIKEGVTILGVQGTFNPMSGDDTLLSITFRCNDSNINYMFTEGAEIWGGHGDWYAIVPYDSWREFSSQDPYSNMLQYIAENIGSMFNNDSGNYTWTYEPGLETPEGLEQGSIKVVVTGDNLIAPFLLIKDSSGSIFPLCFYMAKY